MIGRGGGVGVVGGGTLRHMARETQRFNQIACLQREALVSRVSRAVESFKGHRKFIVNVYSFAIFLIYFFCVYSTRGGFVAKDVFRCFCQLKWPLTSCQHVLSEVFFPALFRQKPNDFFIINFSQ